MQGYGPVCRGFVVTTLLLVLIATMMPVMAFAEGISSPPQPSQGPGGADYPFAEVVISRVGELPSGAWVFAPEGMSGSERSRAPVVLFLHGFGASGPALYRGWITHLARRGNIVIYPDYQPAGFLVPDQSAFEANMLAGLRQGLDEAQLAPAAIHVVGHSLGGVLGVAYLAASPNVGLPPARSLTVVAPGGCRTCGTTSGFGVPLPENLQPPGNLLVNVVVGSDDALVGDGDALAIWSLLDDVPTGQKRLIEVRTDRYGSPDLIADHLFPQGESMGGGVDALDWYGLWRPLDGLIACSETGTMCDIALGTEESDLFMGHWSDGTQVILPVPVSEPLSDQYDRHVAHFLMARACVDPVGEG